MTKEFCIDVIVRKSGNSLVITIPHNIAKSHNIEPGTGLNVNVRLLDNKTEES